MKPLAIVTPWWGKQLKGGAEQQAWQVATRLAKRGHKVEVLTTCCRAFQENWGVNHLRTRVKKEMGVTVRRFRVESRDHTAFDRVNSLMLNLPASSLKSGVSPVSPADAAIFASENINSTQLLNYLEKHCQHYQAFLFIPYLYGPILNGLPLVEKRAFLQPCLHDEVYAYLPQVAKVFHRAKGLLFISKGEVELAQKLYGAGIITKSSIAGAGVEISPLDEQNLPKISGFSFEEERFVLYLGRRDATKNTDILIKGYTNFQQQYPNSNLKLVLAGTGSLSFDKFAPGVVDLGLVEEEEKAALLANCLALFQPSRNESYSRVIMEAWLYKRPVAAHRDCLATAMAVDSSQGGWLAGSEIEWTELFAKLDVIGKEQLAEYGKNGHTYAQENAVWDKVIERYEKVLGLSPEVLEVPLRKKLKEIHQLLPNFSYGDAISNQALAIRDYLRSCGYKSEIFTCYVDERVIQEVKIVPSKKINHQAGLIYHHSIGSEVTKYAVAHSNSKCLCYHNVTPAEFFQLYNPEFAQILHQGRAELQGLAEEFPISVGDSAYDASELAASGFSAPRVLPIVVDPEKWDLAADPSLMEQLQDGRANLLFVGRLVPNKKQDDLLRAFSHYLTMDAEARLILAGWGNTKDSYYCYLINRIKELNLANQVLITGQVNDAQLLAFYRTAHLYWSMSEHEGFGVPLVEAMWFDIPVLAYKSSAVPETLGEAGLMFNSKENLVQVAALAKLMVRDQNLRTKIVKAQRKRRNNFLLTTVQEKINQLILQMEEIR